jgi:hypothetical protein
MKPLVPQWGLSFDQTRACVNNNFEKVGLYGIFEDISKKWFSADRGF